MRERKAWFRLIFVPSPQTSYLPSARKARVMTMNIGALVLNHKQQLEAHNAAIADTARTLEDFQSRNLWARLRWLAVGK